MLSEHYSRMALSLIPLQTLPYLCGWVLIGPKGSVEHDNPILIQCEREGFWLPEPSSPRLVLDVRDALSSQQVQVLHLLQE